MTDYSILGVVETQDTIKSAMQVPHGTIKDATHCDINFEDCDSEGCNSEDGNLNDVMSNYGIL